MWGEEPQDIAQVIAVHHGRQVMQAAARILPGMQLPAGATESLEEELARLCLAQYYPASRDFERASALSAFRQDVDASDWGVDYSKSIFPPGWVRAFWNHYPGSLRPWFYADQLQYLDYMATWEELLDRRRREREPRRGGRYRVPGASPSRRSGHS